MKYCIIFFCLLISSYSYSNQVTGEITEYGIYKPGDFFDVKYNSKAPTNLIKGYERTPPYKVTDLIPVELGLTFGFCYSISGIDNGNKIQIEWMVKHPKYKPSSKNNKTSYSYFKTLNVENRVASFCPIYTFEKDWELVEGDWEFTVSYNSKALLNKSFSTYKP